MENSPGQKICIYKVFGKLHVVAQLAMTVISCFCMYSDKCDLIGIDDVMMS